nr:ESPR-type extended signal peptide-containing protein [Paraburkholderia caribensis]
MNKTYRNVWCAKTATFIAAAETARAEGKSARSGARALSCAVLLTLGGVAGAAHAGALDGGSTAGGIAADIAYGNGAKTTNAADGNAAVAIGQNASANNLSGATPNADGTVAIGDSASATDGGVAVGGLSYAGSMSTAIGAGSTAATANSVALGANSVANSTTLGTAGFAPVGGTARRRHGNLGGNGGGRSVDWQGRRRAPYHQCGCGPESDRCGEPEPVAGGRCEGERHEPLLQVRRTE